MSSPTRNPSIPTQIRGGSLSTPPAESADRVFSQSNGQGVIDPNLVCNHPWDIPVPGLRDFEQAWAFTMGLASFIASQQVDKDFSGVNVSQVLRSDEIVVRAKDPVVAGIVTLIGRMSDGHPALALETLEIANAVLPKEAFLASYILPVTLALELTLPEASQALASLIAFRKAWDERHPL